MFIEPDNLSRIFRQNFDFLIKIEKITSFIIRCAAILLPLNVKICTGSPPFSRLEQCYSLAVADASSLPVFKLPSVDRRCEKKGDGFGFLRQEADDPFDVFLLRDNRGGL